MAAYQLTSNDVVVRTADNAQIPDDPTNRDRADYEAWLANGGVPDPYVPPPSPQQVLSQDMMAQFTVDDVTKIKAAVDSNMGFYLLWTSLQAQKDPMQATNERFLAGWSALVSVLGQARMNQIATALGATSLVV